MELIRDMLHVSVVLWRSLREPGPQRARHGVCRRMVIMAGPAVRFGLFGTGQRCHQQLPRLRQSRPAERPHALHRGTEQAGALRR